MNQKIIFSLSIFCTALVGDYVVFKSKMANSFVFRAVSDNFVHASIGFLSSILFFKCDVSVTSQAKLYNILFCTIISSFIDVDHVFVAKSLALKDYMHLKQRGIFHCTTFWSIVTSLLLAYSCFTKKLNIYVLTWMLILAFTSHHIRDANRRGLCVYPLGHTPPIPKYIYIGVVSVLPIILASVYPMLKPSDRHTILKPTFVFGKIIDQQEV